MRQQPHFQISSFSNCVSIKPNPAKNEVTLTCNMQTGEAGELQLYNSLGNIIYTINVYAHETNINTSGFKSGIYYYRFLINDSPIGQGKLSIIK